MSQPFPGLSHLCKSYYTILQSYRYKIVSVMSLSLAVIVYVCIQSLSCVQILASPWTVAHQASFTVSERLVKLMSIELVMPFNHLILCHPLLLLPSIFPSIRVFSSELVLCIRWSSIRALALASVLPMNIQGSFPLGLTGLISLLSGRDSQEASPAPQFENINSLRPSLLSVQFSSVTQLCLFVTP